MTVKLDSSIINQLKDFFKVYHYEQESVYCYPGQIPMLAFVVIKGIAVFKNKKESFVMKAGELWGLKHILNGQTADYSVTFCKDTDILAIDKTTLRQIDERENPLAPYFK